MTESELRTGVSIYWQEAAYCRLHREDTHHAWCPKEDGATPISALDLTRGLKDEVDWGRGEGGAVLH